MINLRRQFGITGGTQLESRRVISGSLMQIGTLIGSLIYNLHYLSGAVSPSIRDVCGAADTIVERRGCRMRFGIIRGEGTGRPF